MKLFTALLGTETNTFSPFLTGRQNFEQTYLVRNGAHGDNPASIAVPLVRWREMAQARGSAGGRRAAQHAWGHGGRGLR